MVTPSSRFTAAVFVAACAAVLLAASFLDPPADPTLRWVARAVALCALLGGLIQALGLLWNGGALRRRPRSRHEITLRAQSIAWIARHSLRPADALEAWVENVHPVLGRTRVEFLVRSAQDLPASEERAAQAVVTESVPPWPLRTPRAQPRTVILERPAGASECELGIRLLHPSTEAVELRVTSVPTLCLRHLLRR
jgi:hypothetical protein